MTAHGVDWGELVWYKISTMVSTGGIGESSLNYEKTEMRHQVIQNKTSGVREGDSKGERCGLRNKRRSLVEDRRRENVLDIKEIDQSE